MYKRDK